MKGLQKTLFTILGAFALIGLVGGLIFALQFTRGNSILSKDINSGKSMDVYPPPLPTYAYTPLPTSTPVPTQTPTPTPIMLENGWYLYIDKEARYSFSYPPDAYFHTSKEGSLDYKSAYLQFTLPNADGYQGLMIQVLSNPEEIPVEGFAQKIYTIDPKGPSIDDLKKHSEQIKMAGMYGYKYSLSPFFYEFIILLPYEDKVYFIVPVHDNLNITLDPKALELFYKVLDTFALNP